MSTHIPNYGGWRERRGFGVGSLSGRQTAVGLGAVIIALGCVTLVPAALPLLALPAAVIVALVAVRVRGESVAGLVLRHSRWHSATRRGVTRYRAMDSLELPGDLAGLRLLACGEHAVLWDSGRRTVTAIVPVEPAGTELAEPDEVRTWVSGWGDWLAHLGYLEGVVHVVVTVQCTPVVCVPAPQAAPMSDLVGQILGELQVVSAGGCAAQTLISVTMRVEPAGRDAACDRLTEAVATMDVLNRCGVSVLPAWSADEVVTWIRRCYDPSEVPGPGAWVNARPTAVEETWHAYRHDSGISTAFMWDEAPADDIGPTALTRLLGPAEYLKRVSLVFEPVPAHEAAREVDRQAEAAVFRSQYRRRLGRDETARERLDVERARQTAREQAAGSGLVDVGLYAVVTAGDEPALEACAADLVNRAGQSRIRLRRAYGGQASCFAATLGVGFVPAKGWSR